MATLPKPILYSSLDSQWANVPKLGLVEKGFNENEVEIKEIDLSASSSVTQEIISKELQTLVAAENFDPEYLKINPMGTVPSLIVPSLNQPLIDSRSILKYLDEMKTSTLTPLNEESNATMELIIDLVHSDDVNTNLILLRARDSEEYEDKRNGSSGAYIATRQAVLDRHRAAYPDHSFYGPKSEENGMLHKIYTTTPGAERDAFFQKTHEGYIKFAAELDRLETRLVLPYAVGDQVTLADLHVVPWLAHAMDGVNTKEIKDLSMLEVHLQKSVPTFTIGPKTQKWWDNYTDRAAFKAIFPVLH